MKNLIALMILCFCGLFLFPVEVTKPMYWGYGPIILDSQDNMYAGYDTHSIIKFSPQGEELLKMGQDGAGPSDIKRLCNYAYNPNDNNIYVNEFYDGNRWVSKFSTDGKFVDMWKFEVDEKKFKSIASIRFDSQGNVYILGNTPEYISKSNYRLFKIHANLLKYSSKGKYLGWIYSISSIKGGEAKGNFGVSIPFSNELMWQVYQDKIIIKELSGDFIKIYSTNGKLEKQIPFPAKREKLTKNDLDAWEIYMNSQPFIKSLTNQNRASVKKWREVLPFPEYKPNSGYGMVFDSHRNIFITEYRGYGEEEKDYVYFKINLDSGKMEKVQFKSGYILMLIKDNYYYFSKYNEDEDNDTIYKVSEQELKTW